MKLYTEEQVKKAIEFARYCEWDYGGVDFEFEAEYIILEELNPIQLPSDKEINETAYGHSTFSPSFVAGAKWMLSKIQGDSK